MSNIESTLTERAKYCCLQSLAEGNVAKYLLRRFRRLVVKVEVWLFFWGGVLHVHTIYAIHTIHTVYTIYTIYTTPSTLSTLSTPSVSRECPSSPCVTISPSVSSPYAVVTKPWCSIQYSL